MVPKIILEGTRLTFKTEIAFALNEHPRFVGIRHYRYHSPIISGEWCSFTNFPWGRGLINFDPEEEDRAMETYATWVRLFELQRYYSWIIDRFHISTQVFQARRHNKTYDFRWIEERLIPLGFRLVVLKRDPDSFAAARERRLKVSGNPSQYNDLGYFVREQEAILATARKSLLPRLELDVSHNDIARATDEISDWYEKTGGLYLDD